MIPWFIYVRASIDAHQQRIMSETKFAHHQNEIKTYKAIREAKASYMAALNNAKAVYVTAVRKAETACSTSTSEVEAAHTTTVRKPEAVSAVQASKLQQTHQATMQNLEDGALYVEKNTCQSFPQACGVALHACPSKALGKLYVPHTFTNREHVPHWPSNSHFPSDHQVAESHLLTLPPLSYFMTTSDTMWHHAQGCEPTHFRKRQVR